MISELQQFYSEVTKRALLNSMKECGFLLHSFQSIGNNGAQISLDYSEKPLHSFVKALWHSENYAEILEYTATEFENDSVLFYFHLKALKQLNSKNLDAILVSMEKCGKFLSDPFIMYCKALIFFERDDFSIAFAESAKIIHKYPFFWDAWLLLISSVRHEDQIENVVELAKSANSLMSLKAVLHLHTRIRNSNTRNKFLSFESIFKSEQLSNNIYMRNIRMKYSFLEYNGSEEASRHEIPIYVQMADIYSDFLYLHSKVDDLKIFSKYMVASRAWTKECCYVVGNLYSLLRQHEIAIIWLKRALIIDPTYEPAFIVLGNEYIELKAPNDAIAAYSAAIRINPLNYRSFFSLGSVYYLLDDLDRAIYFLKAAIKLEPTDYRPLELLSECHQSLGLMEHAVQFLIKAIGCSGSPYSLMKKLALIYHSISDSKAYLKFYLTYFEKCLSQDEKDCVIILDDFDFEAATNICKNYQSVSILEKLKRALLCYNKKN